MACVCVCVCVCWFNFIYVFVESRRLTAGRACWDQLKPSSSTKQPVAEAMEMATSRRIWEKLQAFTATPSWGPDRLPKRREQNLFQVLRFLAEEDPWPT